MNRAAKIRLEHLRIMILEGGRSNPPTSVRQTYGCAGSAPCNSPDAAPPSIHGSFLLYKRSAPGKRPLAAQNLLIQIRGALVQVQRGRIICGHSSAKKSAQAIFVRSRGRNSLSAKFTERGELSNVFLRAFLRCDQAHRANARPCGLLDLPPDHARRTVSAPCAGA